MAIDQPPLSPQISEVRYAKEQKKLQDQRDAERRRNLDAEARRRTLETKQKK